VACPSNDAWLEQMRRQTSIVRGLGADAILWDQVAVALPYLCFAAGHGHDRPSQSVGPGNLRNVRTVREEVRKEDPNFAFVAEGCYDAIAQFIDIFHGISSYGPDYPAVVRGQRDRPRMAVFPEMFRYTFPEVISTDRIIDAGDVAEANWAFLLGLRFDVNLGRGRDMLASSPELAQRLASLCELRTRLKPYLLRGSFSDNEGFASSNPRMLAKSFRSEDGRRAVVLWNPGSERQAASIDLEGARAVREIDASSESEYAGSLVLEAGAISVLLER